MFTGIVEGTAPVVEAVPARGGLRLVLDLGPFAAGLRRGDSICIAGCCLTVATLDGPRGAFELSPETLARTRFGAVQPGSLLNVERSLRVGDRLGGHFVAGHVDGVGRVESIRQQADFAEHVYAAPPEVAPYLIPKGSVAVEGVSLTVAALLSPGRFAVALIPETLERTTLGRVRAGDPLHMEGDLIGKFVLAQLAASRA